MLDTLPALASSLSATPVPTSSSPTSNYHHLSTFFSTLTPLCTTHPTLFAPHLPALLTFLPGLILPPVDCGPTPTVGRPFPGGSGSRQGAFVFPPPSTNPSSPPPSPLSTSAASSASPQPQGDQDTGEDDDQKQTLRLSTLEFMLSLSEAKPSMVKKVPGWVEIMVRACLEAMGEFEEDEGTGSGLDAWLAEDVSFCSLSSDSRRFLSAACSSSLPIIPVRRILSPRPHCMNNLWIGWHVPWAGGLCCRLLSRYREAVRLWFQCFRLRFRQYIPSMLASYDWRVRHAGLMAIAAIGEGTGKVCILALACLSCSHRSL